ncbi:hypothetical protein [Okibacterium fritillariae]|nr:hypothetical protein [Okibacterium fritillariae]
MEPTKNSLFAAHPAKGQGTLIQYNAHLMGPGLVMTGYADAARRLQNSYDGQPWDDVMLLPFMFVWRQAIELALKKNIKNLAEMRRQNDATDPELAREVVADRLRLKIGHDLKKLISEQQIHNTALGLQEIPEDVLETLELLAAMDRSGTGFRYAGVLKQESIDIDFSSIGAALDKAFRLLEVVIDAATYGEGVDWS